jgi:hypothetical protein
MISAGDEVQERARPNDIGDPEAQIHQDRDHGGGDKAEPEMLAGFKRQPGDNLTRLKKLDDHDNRCVDRATRNQIGGERKIAEPTPQRAVEDKQLDAPQRDAHHEPICYPDDHRRRRGTAHCEVNRKSRDGPDHYDGGQQSQFSFKPRVHATRPGVAAVPTSSYAALWAGHRVNMLSASFRGCAARCRHSMNVVSCAPSSATNTAISSAGSVLLALAETRCVESGGSKNDCPTLNVSTGPPPSCERISPLVI